VVLLGAVGNEGANFGGDVALLLPDAVPAVVGEQDVFGVVEAGTERAGRGVRAAGEKDDSLGFRVLVLGRGLLGKAGLGEGEVPVVIGEEPECFVQAVADAVPGVGVRDGDGESEGAGGPVDATDGAQDRPVGGIDHNGDTCEVGVERVYRTEGAQARRQ